MSIKRISDEIERFLKDKEPEVLYVMGKWGVGKTYAWNLYLREAAKKGEVSVPPTTLWNASFLTTQMISSSDVDFILNN